MDYYLGVAKAEGINQAEIGTVQAVVMAVSAGRVNAQMREAERRTKKESTGTTCTCG